MKLDPSFNYGHLLTVGVIIASVTLYSVQSSDNAKESRADQLRQHEDLVLLRTEWTTQRKEDLRALGDQIANVYGELRSLKLVIDTKLEVLPDQKAQIADLTRRLTEEQVRIDQLTVLADTLKSSSITAGDDIKNIYEHWNSAKTATRP